MTFDRLFVPDAVAAAVSDRAWLAGFLQAERALAVAGGRAGLVPGPAVAMIVAACDPDLYDIEALAVDGRAAGNPVVPLVGELRRKAGPEAGPWVHFGATSQDVLDTAAMLVARDALGLIDAELTAIGDLCAGLARVHRETPMAGRTLLQQAVPTTFGCKAGGWLVGVVAARRRLLAVAAALPAELGGAAGTLEPFGGAALDVVASYAAELGLAEPTVPWHAVRVTVAEIGNCLSLGAGVLEKVALDLVLLAQTEVGEVAEAVGGTSTTMPQKHNPVGAVFARACARGVRANASVLVEGLAGEHERAAGAWHAEWRALSAALALTGGVAAAVRRSLDGLQVDVDRMRANLEAAGGLIFSEHVLFALRRDGRAGIAEAALARVRSSDCSLREALVLEGVDEAEVADLLDPARSLGAAAVFADRSVAAWETM